LWGLEGELEAVISNLLSNSIDAIRACKRKEGEIKVATHVSQHRNRPRILCVVQDNGIGIPVEGMERIFDAGYTTHEGRSGLGLFLIRRIVEHLDGNLEVNSIPGEGTTMTIAFPSRRLEWNGTK
jgi:signal transduction histidine kinase